MVRTIRYGARGSDVADLQQGLNKMPSMLPHLSVDGIYGSNSVGRVQELQRQHRLVSDGIVGPLTWGLFFQLLKQLGGGSGPPPQPPPPKKPQDVLRPQVIKIAERSIGKVNFSQQVGNRPKGIDFIKEIFKKAANINLSDGNFKTSSGSWTHVPIVDGSPKHWCGIFAVYCYREAGINSISWDLRSGKPVGPIQLAQWSPKWINEIKTADIGCVRAKSHHFLIKEVESGTPQARIWSIDGNQHDGQILEKRIGSPNNHKVGKDNFNYYILR